MGNERIDNIFELAADYCIEFIQGEIDSMVGHSPLGKVIGPNSFTPITTADLTFSILGNFIMTFLFQLDQAGGRGERSRLWPYFYAVIFHPDR